MPAPIVIFAFNRLDNLQTLVRSLKAGSLYGESEIHVFVDGPRDERERKKVEDVAVFAASITSHVCVSETNKGLGSSIVNGVTEIVNRYGSVIVLEDDLLLMPGFLTYMNQALDMYKGDDRIFSICGYGLKIKRPDGYQGDVYLGIRSSSWGWGTWADRWNSVDWSVPNFGQLKADARTQRAFNRGGSDMYGMLRDYMDGKNRSWAVRFCYSQFRQGKYSIHPFLSLVDNVGFGEDATNCRQKYSRFRVEKNENSNFTLPADLQPVESILRQLRRYHSIPLRIYSRIRKILNV